MKIIRSNGAASIKQLAVRLGVSEMTIRRNLRDLCETGVLRMMNGVAFCSSDYNEDVYNLAEQQIVCAAQKAAIGRKAASLIEPGDTVFIDCGTTADAMLRYIPQNMDITVICSSLNVAIAMQKKNVSQLIFSGGHYYPATQTFVSPDSVRMLSNMRTNKAFVTAAGISQNLGVTCAHEYEVAIKQVALSNTARGILLADSSKFGKVSPAYFAMPSQMAAVITDDGLSKDWLTLLQGDGIDVIRVAPLMVLPSASGINP